MRLGEVGHFSKNDEYITPFEAWAQIEKFIPKNLTIWEPFYAEGSSGINLQQLGFTVIHNNEDFFQHNHGDIIVTNPPFSKKKEVLARLKELNKPFILLAPSFMLPSRYFQKYFKENIGIIVPSKRIEFLQVSPTGLVSAGQPSFDCLYFCFKIFEGVQFI